ncbi:hypothetical protein C4559_01450 [Candidatus Microgenomates bacterium]|nr:MAG: hypothetical protein C4559_01450 [Candidatus Microgenomates bacterium]
MDNFDAKQYILNNPREADKVATAWGELVSRDPFVQSFETKEDFERYASLHPEKNIRLEEWNGRLVIDAYNDLQKQRAKESESVIPEPQTPSEGIGVSTFGWLATAAVLLQKPEIMEDDKDFKKLEEAKKQKWLVEHPGKDFTSIEGIDYLYGNLEDPGAPTLQSDTEKEFREKHGKKAKKYDDKKGESPYSNPENDPAIKLIRRRIAEHTRARKAYFEKQQNPDIKFEEVTKQIEKQAWKKYVTGHLNENEGDEEIKKKREERIKAYAKKNEGIAKTYNTVTTQGELDKYKKEEVKFTEKIHREPEEISTEKATERLEQITKQQEQKGPVLISPQGKVLSNISEFSPSKSGLINTVGNPLSSDSYMDFQTNQPPAESYSTPQQQQTGGGSSSGFFRKGVNKALRRGGEKTVEKQAEGQLAKKGLEKGLKDLFKTVGKQMLTRLAFMAGLGWMTLGVFAFLFIATFFIVGFGFGGAAGIGGESSIGGGTITPPPSSTSGLDYAIPFRDSSVTLPAGTKEKIKQQYPRGKIDENWDIIVRESIANGWNPAFVLALWIEETGAQSASSYSDPLGCAPDQPTTDINISLKCLFKNFPITKYPNDKFEDFMCVYGGDGFHTAPCIFKDANPNFPGEIKKDYSLLIPSGKGAIVSTRDSASCPVAGAQIKEGSYNETSNTGHCTASYIMTCDKNSRRAKSIDIDTKGGFVELPTINGKKMNWYFATSFTLNSSDCEGGVADCGFGVVFKTKESPNWSLHLLHLDQNSLSFDSGNANESGKRIGKTAGKVYLHINIGKNITNPENVISGPSDLNPGWIKPEDLKMCTN